jgi:hypothetical protein
MSSGTPATHKEMIWIGAGCAAVGFYFVLVGAGVLPVPGGPRNLNAPLWIVAFAGLPFLLGGGAVLLQGLGKANANGELPDGAPTWLRAIQYMMGVAIFASFAVIGTWVALAGQSRGFSGPGGAGVARAMFGLGAAICWACAIGFAISGARKLMSARKA